MCNEAARRTALGLMREDFNQLRIPLRFPEGLPNLAPLDSVRITDATVIVRAAPEGVEMVQRRWSWVGPTRKPVYNYRSEGRRFGNSATAGRCLIPLDGFYEFTDAAASGGAALSLPLHEQRAPPSPRRGAGKKDKWLFTLDERDTDRPAPGLFCVAGLWRAGVEIGSRATGPATGEAFTMLTCEPGPDIAPYHSRQIVLMPRARWADWLDGVVPSAELIAPTPAGTLSVAPAR